MAYQALYRKWRPSVFEDVVGQNHIVETLKNQINTNKIAHAYLFCGSRGTGKTSTAKIFSRAVNCEHPVNGNPCNECSACKGILNNSIFDVIEIDGASNNKVDDIRNIRDEVVYPPADVRYKVYIIDEVHMLTTEAFNALLKTLEEPPQYIIFILATTEFHKIPATIISRCQKFDFKRITYNDTASRIKKVAESDNINVTESAVRLLAKAADGSLRDGLSKLDQCLALGLERIDYRDVAEIIGASDPEFLSDFCDAIIDEKLGQALKLLDDGINMGIDPLRLYTDVIDYFRDLMMIKTSGDYSLIINSEEEVLKKYDEQCAKLTLSRILKIIEVLFEGQNISKYSTSPKLSFETSLLKIASKNTNTDIEALLERVNILEEKIKEFSFNNIINNSAETNKQYDEHADNSFISETVTEDIYDDTLETDNKDIYVISDDTEDNSVNVTEEVSEDDEEYDYSAAYDDEVEEEIEYDFSSITQSEEISSSNEQFDFQKDNMTEDETVVDIFKQDDFIPEIEDNLSTGKENEILNEIRLNFKEFILQIKNKDIGFDNIMKSADISVEENTLVFTFSNKSMLDIAKGGKYDFLIKNTLSDIYNISVSVQFAGVKNTAKETGKSKDPMDDLFEIAEQNQIIFNFED